MNYNKFILLIIIVIILLSFGLYSISSQSQPQFKYVGVNIWDAKPDALNILEDQSNHELWLEDSNGNKYKWLDDKGNVKTYECNSEH